MSLNQDSHSREVIARMATDPIPSEKAPEALPPTGATVPKPTGNRVEGPPRKESIRQDRPAAPGEEPANHEHLEGRKRPRTVTLLGTLNIILGLVGSGLAIHVWLRGTAYVLLFGDASLSQFGAITLNICCGLILGTSIVLLVSGAGFWLLKPWARVLAIVVSLAAIAMDVVFSAIAILVFGVPLLITISVASMAYALLLLLLMHQRHVVVAFLGAASAEAYQTEGSRFKEWLRGAPGWISSILVHATVLLLLGLISLPTLPKLTKSSLTALNSEEVQEIESLDQDLAKIEVEFEAINILETDISAEAIEISEALEEPAMASSREIVNISPVEIDVGEMETGNVGGSTTGGFAGRSGTSRQRLVATGGGTQQSEDAVTRALTWLKNHQTTAGNWNFQHHKGPCRGRCDNQGRLGNAMNGATAMGLLPFLGAGHTHRDGPYKQVVKSALAYLVKNMRVNRNIGSFVDGGTFYSHGLGSIALCEAYAMTHDKTLLLPAQRAIGFIVYAQDPVGGGWRYGVGQQGDTSVVGWQLMALKSAHMGSLHVPPNVVAGVNNFLNTVQTDNGAAYGYRTPDNLPGTTAIGLLMRMYLGWEHDDPTLRRGVERLSIHGPSKSDMYYNYYATQVMHHYGGPMWQRWNQEMREYLVISQVRDPKSHENGSWHFNHGHYTNTGGRLYNTALATMILEVYYRHLPLYGEEASADDFQ